MHACIFIVSLAANTRTTGKLARFALLMVVSGCEMETVSRAASQAENVCLHLQAL